MASRRQNGEMIGSHVFGLAFASATGSGGYKNALDSCSGFGSALGARIRFVIHGRWIHPHIVVACCRGGGDPIDSGKTGHPMKVFDTGDAGYPEDEAVLTNPFTGGLPSASGMLEKWSSRGMEVVRNHPVASVLGAFAIGILIAKVAHRERT